MAQEPRIPASQRPEVPLPPSFHEDLFMTAFQMGAAVQAQQAQFLAQAGGFNIGTPPPAPNQPQGAPEPEQPGAGEPPSEQDTATGVETIDDDSDAETLRFNEGEDRSDYPENTDTDPYEDAENPTGSQAEAEQAPDIEHIDIDDSRDEEGEAEVIPEQPQSDLTPETAIEAATGAPPELTVTEEPPSKPSKPPAFTGSIGDWYRLKASSPQELKKPSPAEPKHGKSPEKASLAMSGEHSAPQVSSSEATSSKEDKEQPSNPTQGEGGSSSTSQAARAETSAAASEDPNHQIGFL